MGGSIRFLLGDELRELSGFDPQMTVLEWLRTREGRTGTKEGCAEGDCGACTVALGELHDGRVRYRAYNACILLLPVLDGRQLLTVEDLADARGGARTLHPVQQALVDEHGSQCGFCTPGFVMSLFTLFHSGAPGIGRRDIDRAIAGNLCRCTGYAPIVRAAGKAMEQAPEDRYHKENEELASRLKQLRRPGLLHLEYQGRHFHAPQTLAELWELLAQNPDARLVAGATDVGLWITKQLRVFDTLIHVGSVRELKRIEQDRDSGELTIGAAVTYTDALETLVARYPGMQEMLLRLGADQVRNAGTIGGNIANGSPIGDMPPALIALGARLVVSGARGRRELDLEDFFQDYGKQDLRQGECVEAVKLPPLEPGRSFAVYKLSKRFDQDISSVCGAFSVLLAEDKVSEARICFGGMAGIPARARATEKALVGRRWDEQAIREAAGAMAGDYTPISDWRASADYRMLAAQNLLRRFFLETGKQPQCRLAVVTPE